MKRMRGVACRLNNGLVMFWIAIWESEMIDMREFLGFQFFFFIFFKIFFSPFLKVFLSSLSKLLFSFSLYQDWRGFFSEIGFSILFFTIQFLFSFFLKLGRFLKTWAYFYIHKIYSHFFETFLSLSCLEFGIFFPFFFKTFFLLLVFETWSSSISRKWRVFFPSSQFSSLLSFFFFLH